MVFNATFNNIQILEQFWFWDMAMLISMAVCKSEHAKPHSDHYKEN